MVQPIQKIWNPNTQQWEQIVPTKEEFDGLAGTGRTTETVKGNKDQIDVLSQNVNTHLSEKASQDVLGHVKRGDGVQIDADGVISADVKSVAGKTGAVTLTKSDVGLSNVDNVKQLPISGGTMTGILYPQNNTSYTTGQARRIVLSTSNPSGGGNGDVWLKYE